MNRAFRLVALMSGFLAACGASASADDSAEGWVELTPGNLDAWRPPRGQWQFVEGVRLDAEHPRRLRGEGEGGDILLNGPIGRTGNLLTKQDFGDVELHVEFVVPKGSNSGVKLHGHYEIQIADSWGRDTPKASDCGGIYPRAELLPSYHHIDEGYPPKRNASKAPGEWQTLDIVFRAPRFDAGGKKIADAKFVKVALNGQVVQEDQSIPCPTGHAWHNKEVATGPILLQGDHGPCAFRNIRVRPLADDGLAQEPSKPPEDINKSFENPDVDEFVARFENESREVYARRGEIVAALGLKPGMAVADVGAGTGLFTRLFADAVGPEGRVYAVDIAQPFLDHIAKEAKERGQEQVRTIRGTQDSTNLPEGSVDAVFLADTYHHLEKPADVLASIHRALKPGGRLFVVEFDRREGQSTEFILKHVRADRGTFVREIRSAGFEPIEVESAPELKENFFAAFRKSDRPVEAGDTKGDAPRRP